MTSLPDGVIPTPAANSRSPNRQPRYRGAVKAWLREVQWETYLSTYAMRGKEAAEKAITTPCVGDLEQEEAIQNTRDRVRKWVNENPEEKIGRLAQLTEACKLWERRVKDREEALQEQIKSKLDPMTVKSLEVVEATLDDPDKDVRVKALKANVAVSHLKGVRVYSEKQKVEAEVTERITIVELGLQPSEESK